MKSEAPREMLLEQLFLAIANGCGVMELEQYLAAAGTVNDKNPVSGWSLLHEACEHQNHAVIRALLQRGADVNVRANNNPADTPLHLAVDIDIDSTWQRNWSFEQVTFETSQLLLKAGADPDLPDSTGRTPREIATRYGSELAERFNNIANSK
jgi:ankyrin repeat protein